jgi:hypothetical protein
MNDIAISDFDRFEMRVRDAIAANVDLMAGPPRIIERTLASSGKARRRRRARMVAVGLTAATVGAVGIAVASGWRPPS